MMSNILADELDELSKGSFMHNEPRHLVAETGICVLRPVLRPLYEQLPATTSGG